MITQKYIAAKKRATEHLELDADTPIMEVVATMKEKCKVLFDQPESNHRAWRTIYNFYGFKPPRFKQEYEPNKTA